MNCNANYNNCLIIYFAIHFLSFHYQSSHNEIIFKKVRELMELICIFFTVIFEIF